MSKINLFGKNKKAEEQVSNAESPKSSTPEAKSEPQCNPESEAEAGANKSDSTLRVHNLIILDESGSMTRIFHPALTGVNETLQTIRDAQNEHKNQEHFVTLVTFETSHYKQIYAHVPVTGVIDITEKQYCPGGRTPLYDALGKALTELRPKVKKGDVVLVTVITDGYENASIAYSGMEIKALIESLKSEGWVFTYIGANQDVEAVAASMSINNHLAFDANEASTNAMFEHERWARRRFYSLCQEIQLCRDIEGPDLNSGYFDDDKEADDKEEKC